MTRKNIVFGSTMLVVLLLVGGVILILLLRHEKSYYAELTPPPGPERERDSKECFSKIAFMTGSILGKTNEWNVVFSDREINSYLIEDFQASGLSAELLPEEIHDPRVSLEENGIVRLGFHYGDEPWTTLITVVFRVWLANGSPNTICLELQSMHAGGLPISGEKILERVFEVARRRDIAVSKYRHNGHLTGVLQFQSAHTQPSVQLKALQVSAGRLYIGGQSVEPPPPSQTPTPRAGPGEHPEKGTATSMPSR